MATVSERVKKIIASQLGVAESEIKPEARFTEDLNADSLDMVELTMAMEEEFSTAEHSVSIPDEDADSIKTVRDAIDYINYILSPNAQDNPSGRKYKNTVDRNANPAKKPSFFNNLFKNKRGK